MTSAELIDRLSADQAFGCAADPREIASAFLASYYLSDLTAEVISVSLRQPTEVK
ncbi:hypothetical protein [Mycobacterium sp. UM_CSW]|uniref:hypothetical protein n=1 Tax=Mycobacterium sp. UM_CSW TaxID=1370119 RepID=UPI00041B5822|nr:hypothetical protein [Mycobacterium sp. UM_CSW]